MAQNQTTSNQVDSITSAELPNPVSDPVLFAIIKRTMVHGPCGNLNPSAPCMENGKCLKRYPRQLMKNTQTGTDRYPLYRRRKPEDGRHVSKLKMKSGVEVDIDNRWIVPYCPLLSKAYDAHINVKFCNSIKSIKYVCKYVNKGSDAAMYALQNQQTRDEMTQYQSGRYISSNEAFWRIFGFPIHERHPAIQQLSIHFQNGQRVFFTEETALQQALAPKQTTAFFNICQTDSFARTLLYSEIVSFYTWSINKWNRRKRGSPIEHYPGIFIDETLARIYTVHPTQHECFYLRKLLLKVRGPTSFEDLRTVDGQLCATYKEACLIRGLLEDDAQWEATMTEVADSESPGSPRNLFAISLQVCGVSNPLTLWQNHKQNLSEDFKHLAQVQNNNVEIQFTDIFNFVLIAIEDTVLALGGKEFSTFGLPEVQNENQNFNRDVLRELCYNTKVLHQEIESNEPKLLPDQKAAYSAIAIVH